MPLLAVFRDTLGDVDSANDRLRQVWVFTYASPAPPQRIAGGSPRAGITAAQLTELKSSFFWTICQVVWT
jgi:hypothetical protein